VSRNTGSRSRVQHPVTWNTPASDTSCTTTAESAKSLNRTPYHESPRCTAVSVRV